MAVEEEERGRPEFSPLSIARMVWKRKSCIVLTWIVLAACAAGLVWRAPAVYMAEAVVLVDSQKIPETFVSATVASDLEDRIATIRQQILSSGKLKRIIDDFGLYRRERATHFEEEILEMMRRDISITLEASGSGRRAERPGAFRIGFQGPDPTVVTQVANRLTNLYIDENLRTREVQAEGTSEFLDAQLQDAKKRLDELEAAVSSYKLRHNGELPQQETSLGVTLSRLQVELEANRDALNRAQQNKIILENSLGAAETSLAAQMRPIESAGGAGDARISAGQVPGQQPMRSQSSVLREQYATLRARYREDHPDVKTLRLAVQRAEEEEQAAGAATAAAALALPPPPARIEPAAPVRESAELARAREQVAGLKAQISATEAELTERRTEQERIRRDIVTYQSRIERLPVREQEMAQITRDYEISRENYRSLLDKKNAAGMALDMERRQKSERFTVLDPARVPEKPVKPNRPMLYGAGMGASLAFAMVLGLALELRKNVFLGEWEFPPNVTVLARLPQIDVTATPSTRRKAPSRSKGATGKRRLAGVSAALLSLVGVIAAALYFLFQRP